MSNKNGQIINCIQSSQYDNWEGINASSLKKFIVSPLHYKDWLDHKDEEKVGDAFRIGTAVHMAILEPHLLDERYLYAPEVDRRTKTGKDTWNEFLAKLNPKQDNFLYHEEVPMIEGMMKRVAINEFWTSLTPYEDTTFREAGFECEYLGIKIKGRLDFYNHTKNVIVDWKTINETPTKRVAKNEIRSKGYDIQSFLYQKGVEIVTGIKPKFYFGFIEKKSPYAIAFYELPQWWIDETEQLVATELVRMHNAKLTGIYSGLPSENTPFILE